ncbi:aldo/keto reductase [Aquipluma nitroreducens]|uniref:Aldo/keto reductase n=1 Tax=Aquipluma nitroreducens TaxID=2010828 RepID=A0A5K7SFJ4_9BACT|nr:aldo/keto reductase [Aquipluma nitroreducens]BBE20239.1 aldo/keto reductase [Aquipluma nitroreducens]
MNDNYSRRKFIKGTVGTSLLVAGAGLLPSCSIFRMSEKDSSSIYDAKGLPTVMFGKTGVPVPRIVCGLGSRFCHLDSEEEAQRLLNYTLDHGLYYWDTAWAYDNTIGLPPGKIKSSRLVTSEVRLGPVVKTRRNEIFLSTKVTSRDPNEAMQQIETSLKRLQTDHLDQLMIHDVQSLADVDKLSEKGNLIDILHYLKEQGLTRFIGFSGHTESAAMKEMADRGDFDTMLIAMNHWNAVNNPQKRFEMAVPAAKAKGMGVIMMKVVRPRETITTLKTNDLIKYALSLKGPDVIVLGLDSIDVVKSNIEILKNFKPMDEAKMQEMAQQLTPFFNHENLPWMQPGYCDGNYLA